MSGYWFLTTNHWPITKHRYLRRDYRHYRQVEDFALEYFLHHLQCALENLQANAGKYQLQNEKTQGSLEKAQNEFDRLQEKFERLTNDSRRVSEQQPLKYDFRFATLFTLSSELKTNTFIILFRWKDIRLFSILLLKNNMWPNNIFKNENIYEWNY